MSSRDADPLSRAQRSWAPSTSSSKTAKAAAGDVDAAPSPRRGYDAPPRRRAYYDEPRRYDDDEYGDCLDCGEAIAIARLEARPETPFCVRCQENRERR